MCLLIKKPAAAEFDFADISDFYYHNSDGFGVMYAEGGVLRVFKTIPANASEAWEFYVKHAQGRDCVAHMRMKTHGHIDLTNCHPYEVFGDGADMPLYLAHNGVLSHGNSKDASKSDTWHFINDVLRPILKHAPELAFEPAFIELLENEIGSSNKFAMMNHEGRIALVNEDAFVEYKGALLSNTYAWSAHKGGYGVKSYGRFDNYTTTSMRFARKPYYTSAAYGTNAYADWWEDELAGKDNDPFNEEPDPVGQLTDKDADDEAWEFADMFFDALDAAGLRNAYKTLTWDDVVDYYCADPEMALTVLDMVEKYDLTDAQVIRIVEQAQLRQAQQS